jgi:hypothetical protein
MSFFISTGELSAMYTLREYGFYYSSEGQKLPTSYYHSNLSIDKNKAIEKAKAITGLSDIPFDAPENLSEYREGVAEAARIEQEARQAAYEERQREQQKAQYKAIEAGLYPFGYNTENHNKPIKEIEVSLLNWWATKAEVEENSPAQALKVYINKNCKELLLPTPNNEHVGTIKKRQEFNVTVVRKGGFQSYDYYGNETWTSITTMITDKGHCLVVFSAAWSANPGEKLKIKATVKDHSDYDGQAQTIVQRVKTL